MLRNVLGACCLSGLFTVHQGAIPAREPIAAILDAFHAQPVVALSEGDHGNRQSYEFRLALIRDPRFPSVVNDIVVESGNALYQSTMDQFVQGADVPLAELRKVWENTTQPFTTFDIPMYRGFFEAVRSLNARLPRERQLRVLLGDPPIDWDQIHTKEEATAAMARWLPQRDSFPANVIRREVVEKGRHALVVYGGMHLQRKQVSFNYSDDDGFTIVAELERSGPVPHVFNIWTNTRTDLQQIQSTTGWPIPSIVSTAGTALGAEDFTRYEPAESHRVKRVGTALVDIPRTEWINRRMADQFDAILYLGPPSSISEETLSPELCKDTAYMTMRTERFRLIGMDAGAERLKTFCANK